MIRDGEWTLIDHDFKLKRTVWAKQNPDGSTTTRTGLRMLIGPR